MSSHELEFRYHSNEELASVLKNFSLAGDPKLRKNLYDIGYSSGRPKSSKYETVIHLISNFNKKKFKLQFC